ncbi:MAG: helix-turn-helix domain-containing protein [Chloroflexi bacterium]|nr:helix-turn-helix domain-containing protein [Chloroflexota bacterium]
MGRRVTGPELDCRVRARRVERGLSQQQLAVEVGVTRQALGAIEAGRYVPNTAVALRLAQALACRVEDLFVTPERTEVCPVDVVGPGGTQSRRLALANVRGRWLGHRLAGGGELHEGFVGADGILTREMPGGQAELLVPRAHVERTALVLGCDPSLGIVGAHLARRTAEGRLLWLFAPSQAALDAVARGEAHVAGSHLRAPESGEYNVPQARRALARTGGIVVAFARWELGLVLRPGNPKGIRTVADLARPDVRMVNRERGAGSRALLDDLLAGAGVPAAAITGYDQIAAGHLAVARAVATGGADTGIAPRAVAGVLDLDFVALAEVRFDFSIPADLLDHPAVALLLDLLQSRALRAEMRALSGYDVDRMGTVIATIPAASEQ